MRALAVEDDPRIAADLQAALTAAGFCVEVTGDGEDAWFLGDTEDFDLWSSISGCLRLTGWRCLSGGV